MPSRALDLLAAAGYRVEQRGRLWWAQCPFHADGHPSLACYEDHAHCYACSWSGGYAKLLHEWKGLAWKDAFRTVGEEGQVQAAPPLAVVPTDEERAAMTLLWSLSRKALRHHREAQRYLERRGLDWRRLEFGVIPRVAPQFRAVFGGRADQIAERIGLLRASKARLNHRLFLPAVEDGQAVWYQARAIRPVDKRWRYLSPPRFKKRLLGLERTRKSRLAPVVIVEGAFDAAPCWLLGQPAIALAGASLAVLDELLDAVNGRPVLLALDRDDTGQAKAPLLARQLTGQGIPVAPFPIPAPHKDPGAWWAAEPWTFRKALCAISPRTYAA